MQQLFHDHRFCGLVSAADKVAGAFCADLQVLDFAKILQQSAACLASGFHHHV